jgi:aminoglycoside phosphotransferase
MRLVREQTNVPFPRVLIAWTDKKGKTHLVMQRIKGQELGPLWDRYSGEEKEAISSQLKALVSQYRAFKPCHIAVGSTDHSTV